jgi:hypothetical protein
MQRVGNLQRVTTPRSYSVEVDMFDIIFGTRLCVAREVHFRDFTRVHAHKSSGFPAPSPDLTRLSGGVEIVGV